MKVFRFAACVARRLPVSSLGAVASLAFLVPCAGAQVGSVTSLVEIDSDSGGFGHKLPSKANFGSDVTSIGDLDGDGVADLAVGANDAGVTTRGGSLWIVDLLPDGTVKSEVQIGQGLGGFGGTIQNTDEFGTAVASLGRTSPDAPLFLAVGAPRTDEMSGGRTDVGAVWILQIDPTGTVIGQTEISRELGGFNGMLLTGDLFGTSLANLGDLDGDGTADLAVGVSNFISVCCREGGVYILFMTPFGTVKRQILVGSSQNGFHGALQSQAEFGAGVARIDDLDGDGVPELAVGNPKYNLTGASSGAGAVWIVYLNADGTVKDQRLIGNGTGGFSGVLAPGALFGSSVASLPDLNLDGVPDLAVGAPGSDAVWILFLNEDGTVNGELELADGLHGLVGAAPYGPEFGASVACIGDLDGDGNPEMAVGSTSHQYGTLVKTTAGALFVLSLCDADVAADFGASPTTGPAPLDVSFVDESVASGTLTYDWDFGDGTFSQEEDPLHTYTLPGTYTVRLTVTGVDGACGNTKCDLIVVDGAPASATDRNGTGSNPDVFSTVTLPVLGTTWTSTVDAGSVGASGLTFLVGYTAPLAGLPTALGELLLDPTSDLVLIDATATSQGVAQHDIAIPNDLSLQGFLVSTQVLLDATKQLTNALDLVVGT